MTLKKHKGGQSELLAVCKLWQMGYEVFRNQSATGPIDIIAVDENTGLLRKFDVKTATEFLKKNGEVWVQGVKLTEKQIALGVELILVTSRGNVYVGIDSGSRRSDDGTLPSMDKARERD